MSTTREKMLDRRMAKMRMGQSVAEVVVLPSDDETRFFIVALTEAEFTQVLEIVASMTVPDTMAGMQLADRRRAQETLIRAIREEEDLSERVFSDVDELLEVVEVSDVDYLIDEYNRLTENSSPALEGLPQEEFRNLKELLQVMDWNALSGRAWYAAKRFLSEITPTPLLDNSPGSSSISTSTTTKESEKSTTTA